LLILICFLVGLCNVGVLKKYIDNKWQEIEGTDRFKLTKIEGQVRR